ncbi:flavin reductase (DIM6/NTAB) family NADH-FMN oxidoreductase RutF [Microbacterium resistens]|uniref:Flavin reductase (DIM6/NTAB) family NADH-FMN oxidoreductase RutF n=1 Tax=Microbacterium resistens TaxID=156977 RepID=A0ABU1SDV8_9MICO|nr:flavin reductase family protein [Microbacterium resistens]MDR6867774.1 flavin reductase (DIM6/NTAB) family NADH-FMN oxidoreductase RutF [Microbacterium resistens]
MTGTTPEIADEFKDAFRSHPAGVSLVTASTAEGPVGLTLSSVASVSADPAVLVFSVTKATGSAGGILGAPSMVVHFLLVGQEGIADAFARSGQPRFTSEQGWQTLATGEPYLPSARVALRCTIRETLSVGGSALVLADVVEVLPGVEGDPLLYHDRHYDRLAVPVR